MGQKSSHRKCDKMYTCRFARTDTVALTQLTCHLKARPHTNEGYQMQVWKGQSLLFSALLSTRAGMGNNRAQSSRFRSRERTKLRHPYNGGRSRRYDFRRKQEPRNIVCSNKQRNISR